MILEYCTEGYLVGDRIRKMKIENFLKILGKDFFVGVPDSQLKALCDCLLNEYGVDNKHHIIAANEGNCVGIAAGYYLATRKVPVIYLQNSGEGNIINPIVSLANENVYAIPMILIIGWRGEPGVYDEPQHFFQGQITLKLLKDLNIDYFVVDKNTKEEELKNRFNTFEGDLSKGKQVAFVIKKNALDYGGIVNYLNNNKMFRETIIEHIVDVANDDPIICTTGKASRELFEIRVRKGQSHEHDFLTVGSMGHSSSIALGVALNKLNKKIWCIDGDGAALMHMGAMAVIGSSRPNNLIHIVINNGAHESVGGMPTVADGIVLSDVARACGYLNTVRVVNEEDLVSELRRAKNNEELSFIEVCGRIGARAGLGRPTNSPINNKISFMENL